MVVGLWATDLAGFSRASHGIRILRVASREALPRLRSGGVCWCARPGAGWAKSSLDFQLASRRLGRGCWALFLFFSGKMTHGVPLRGECFYLGGIHLSSPG